MADEEENMESSSENKFSPSVDNEGVPTCLQWSVEDVAEWIISLGFPQYKDCFVDNVINGRKLITIDASTLPNIGITDFEHMKIIAKKIRHITYLEEPDWNRSIGLQHRERLGLFLEKRTHTGCEGDGVTYNDYHRYLNKMEEHSPFKRVTFPSALKPKSKSLSNGVN